MSIVKITAPGNISSIVTVWLLDPPSFDGDVRGSGNRMAWTNQGVAGCN
jgi:hypothetical protein